MRRINVSDCTSFIKLGICGENRATEVVFDLAGYINQFGDGHATVINFRPNDETAYPIICSRIGDELHWIIDNVATGNPGNGQVQLNWVVDDVIAKSDIYNTHIKKSIEKPGETPLPVPDWTVDVIKAGKDAVDSAKSAEQSSNSAADSAKNASVSEENVNSSKVEIDKTAEEVGKKATEVGENTKQVALDKTAVDEAKKAIDLDVQNVTELVKSAETAQGEAVKAKDSAKTAKTQAEQFAKQSESNSDLALKIGAKPELSGNPVVATDSTDYPALAVSFDGSTTQNPIRHLTGSVITADKVAEGQTVPCKVESDNILPFPYESTSKRVGNVDVTINEDGTITVNSEGVAEFNGEGYAIIQLLRNDDSKIKDTGNMTLTGCPKGEGVALFLAGDGINGVGSDYGNGASFKIANKIDSAHITLWAGNEFNNLVFKPMLNKGTEAKPYTKHVDVAITKLQVKKDDVIVATYDVQTNGTVLNLQSISPNMTLVSDTDGVTIDAIIPEPIVNGELSKIGDNGKNLIPNDIIIHQNVQGNAIWIYYGKKGEKRISLPKGTFMFSNNNKVCSVIRAFDCKDDSDINASRDSSTLKFTLEKPTDVYFMTFKAGNTVEPIQCEYGSVATSYEPPKGKTLKFSQPIELSKWDSIQKRDGIWGKVNGILKTIINENTQTYRNMLFAHTVVIDISAFEGILEDNYESFNSTYLTTKYQDLEKVSYGIKTSGYASDGTSRIWITDERFKTIEEFKNHFATNPLTIISEKREKTFEPLPEADQLMLNSLETYYPNTVMQTDEGVTLNLKYLADTENYVAQRYAKLEQKLLQTNKAITSLGEL